MGKYLLGKILVGFAMSLPSCDATDKKEHGHSGT